MTNVECRTDLRPVWSLASVPLGLLLAVAVVCLAVGVCFLSAKVGIAPGAANTPTAQVDSHVVHVTPRVSGHVRQVLVDSRSRAKQGDLLVELDPEPFEVQVSIKRAVVAEAEADVAVAQAQAYGMIAQVRANRFKLQQAVENVNAQIANLRADVASLNSKRAALELARTNLKRGEDLAASGVLSKSDLIKRQKAVGDEEAAVEQALQVVNAARTSIGLTAEPTVTPNLGETPADLDQNDASVREALLELLHPLALLGYTPPSWKATPQQIIEDFHKQDSTGDLDRIYTKLVEGAPTLRQAQAKHARARRELELAELDLRYCRITSAVDGVVAHRNVNPGDHVEVGQILMEIRPLTASD